MAIEIQERFSVSVPIDSVWPFLIDPGQVVTCMPGAALDEQLDDTTFVGTVQVKLGAVKTRYKCKVKLTAVDEHSYSVHILADGRENSGGTLKGILTSTLRSLPDGGTEVSSDAKVDLTGRVAQLGQGLIRSVAQQLFRQFAENMRERLERDPSSVASVPTHDPPTAVRVLPMILGTLRSAIARWLGRLLGRSRE